MTDSMKSLLVILIILYVISPIDLCPGPIDDAIVVLMALASGRDS